MDEVVWPLAPSAVVPTSLAPRLADLRGKTVGELWDYLFRGELVFPLLREHLARRFPGVRFVEYAAFGSTHGRGETELMASLPALLRQHGCDAVVSAVGA
jgi:hypothetical protein